MYPWFLLLNTGWLVVPLFFALSGYLITQILYSTKGRAGYFKVFYGRRALRVFPLYYLTILICFAIVAWKHWSWNWHTLGFFFYLQNFTRHSSLYLLGGRINTAHFWSLAVEEHFYLIWPLVVWLCSSREQLLKCCYAILIMCFAVRVAWPLFGPYGFPIQLAYTSTLTRVDAIICGAIVALLTDEYDITEWMKRTAAAVIVIGVAILLYQAVRNGHSMPEDYFSVVAMTPLANAIATSLLILLLREDTWLSRSCSQSWICKLGRLSYGLYVFHELYCEYFVHSVIPRWSPACGAFLAELLGMSVAFAITLGLAVVAYYLIERPGQMAKRLLNYGAKTATQGMPTADKLDELVNVHG